MRELHVRGTAFMTDAMDRQEYEEEEKRAKAQIRSWRKRYENRILKDASAVDLILDYYTIP